MKKLFLFDIDGTLITSRKNDRFAQAINNIYNLDASITEKDDFHGSTDRLILIALLEDKGWPKDKINDALPGLLTELDRMHQTAVVKEGIQLLPGVKPLLEVLKQKGEVLGLITGNIQAIAQRKLETAGIYSYFTVGGFGSDPHVTRADLVKVAIEKAGFTNQMGAVYVIGDTARDIQAAAKAGVTHSVGVAHYRSVEELTDAGAEIVLADFKNTADVVATLSLDNST